MTQWINICTIHGIEQFESEHFIVMELLDGEMLADRIRRGPLGFRPDDASVLYNAACAFCILKKKPEALDALRKARDAGFRDSDWARRDPDLALLDGDPEFDRLYPPSSA